MNELLDKLKDSLGDLLGDVRLSEVNVFLRQNTLELVFVCPEKDEKELLEIKDKIVEEAKKAIGISFKIKVKIKKSYFDEAYFTYTVLGFFDKYPIIRHSLGSGDFAFEYGENCIKVTISVIETLIGYINDRKILSELNGFVYNNFCDKIAVELAPVKLENEEIDIEDDDKKFVYDFEGGRNIKVENVESFIGDAIFERPGYVVDARPGDGRVLCGRIKDFNEHKRKLKEGETEQKFFFKFRLEDFTGSIECIYFPTKKTLDKVRLLHSDREIVAFGRVENNTFNGNTTLVFRPRFISLCTLPTEFVINRARMLVPKTYKKIVPQPFVSYEQDNIFDSKREVSEFLKGKQFVVFDLETTGLNRLSDKILEIGAVKIVDGSMTESFSTLIDPQCLIPEKATSINGITNADVKGMPTIEEVMPDFFKFCDGATMVGQNSIDFDTPFVRAKAEPMNIYFDNEQLDIMLMAKKLLPSLNRYNLNFLAKYFGFVNEEAHRALSDAVTTAKIFLKLAEITK